jgi:hypothetical protein
LHSGTGQRAKSEINAMGKIHAALRKTAPAPQMTGPPRAPALRL